MQLSCNYVHGFKRLSMFIFAFHLNFVSKSCDHVSKSCDYKFYYEEASVFSRTMEQRDTFMYILISISKFCSSHKV